MNSILFIIICFLGVFFQLAFHELGHLAGALAGGFESAYFRIGNLYFYKRQGKTFCRCYGPWNFAVEYVPASKAQSAGDMNLDKYFLGGPCASLALGLLLFAAGSLPAAGSMAGTFLKVQGIFGAAYGAFHLAPSKGPALGDNSRRIYLKEHKGAREAFWKTGKLLKTLAEGKGYEDCPPQWFEQEEDSCKDPYEGRWAAYEARYFRAKGQFDIAGEICRTIFDAGPSAGEAYREAGCQLAVFDMIKGERSLEKLGSLGFSRGAVEKLNPPLVKYHMLYAWEKLINKNPREAQNVRREFEEAAKKAPFPGEALLEARTFDFIEIL